MIDEELVTRKALLIARDLEPLGDLAQLEREAFVASRSNQVLAERYLERIIGRIIDVNGVEVATTMPAKPLEACQCRLPARFTGP